MAEGAPRGAAALRVRQRFSGFYDLKVRQDGNEHDINSTTFNPETYVQSVLSAKTLPELVQHSNELSVEIKELDSDMQMLVYENYNKFISTTDTIQDMKTKVDGMEGDLGRLTTAVSEITESSSRINENLADRRVRIQKLNGVRRLLKKLSFIFELPTRLKRTVELDAGAEAVKYWRTAMPVLRAYKHVPSFQAVEAEANEILLQLKEKLRTRLQSLDVPPAEAQEAATLLIQLGEPAGPMRQQFVKLFSARLRLPAALTQKGQKAPSSNHPPQASMAICVPDGPLSSEFVNTAKNMILGYQMLLPGGGGGVDAAGGGAQIGMGVVGGAAAATREVANGVASGATGGQAMGGGGAKEGEDDDEEAKQLVKVVDEIFKNYLEALRQVVREADGCDDVSPLVALLERWHDSMRGIEALMPQVQVLAGAADEIVTLVLTNRISAAFASIARKMCHAVVALAPAAKAASREGWRLAVANAYGESMAAFQEGVAALRPLFVERSPVVDGLRAGLADVVSTHMATLLDRCLWGSTTDGGAAGVRGWEVGEDSWVGKLEGHVVAGAEFALLLCCVFSRMRQEGLEVMAASLFAFDKRDLGVETCRRRLSSLVVTLRQRYLLVRGLSVSKDLLRAKGLSAPVEAATLQEQILLAEGKGGLEIGGVILKAAKDAAAELSAVLPMASVGTEEDAFVPLMSLMEAVALSQKAVEEETGKREGAILLQALVVQALHTSIQQLRLCTLSQAEVKHVQEQMTALHKGLADIVGVSLDASLLHIISEVTAEAEDRCA